MLHDNEKRLIEARAYLERAEAQLARAIEDCRVDTHNPRGPAARIKAARLYLNEAESRLTGIVHTPDEEDEQ
jgi:hypothetical protein